MISAPREMRCRSMPTMFMTANTMASEIGIASATTVPARMPRLTKLTTAMMAIACHSEVVKIADRLVDDNGLVSHQRRLDAERQVCRDLGHHGADVLAERQDIAAIAHGDAEADRRLAVDAELRLRRAGIAAPDFGDVAQADEPAIRDDVEVEQVLLVLEGAGDTQAKCVPRRFRARQRG